jgi:hypothetical protein
MKYIVFFAAAAISLGAFAQAQKPEPIKAEPIKAEAPKPKAAPAKPIRHTNKRQEDARHCLALPTNTEIIKCAEEYL